MSQLGELLGVGLQFEFGSDDLFHRTRIPKFRAFVKSSMACEHLWSFLPLSEARGLLTTQVERLLIAPIGRLGDHLSEHSVKRATDTLVERITASARERLPAAIAEFDVGGLVRRKVSEYPNEKLEALILSVAAHHPKTIELFGAVIGLFIGVGQVIYFWLTYAPRH